ncbi:DUF11 domain-containing protein, partial [Acidobacteria bacterium ACD]|nr:DUF11 domain-containing protein [Acidobacteria bacterium ACD]
MRSDSRTVVCLVASSLLLVSRAAGAATSTSFSPTSVVMAQGASTTITIGTVGLSAGPDPAPAAFAAYFQIVLPAGYTVSNVACVGLFAGATPSPDPIAGGAVSCEFPWIGVTASAGDVMTFTLTRGVGASTGVVSMDDLQGSFYALTNEDIEPVGTTNTVTILDPEPDLAIAKSHSGTFTQGQPGSYTLTVSNVGAGLTATGFSGTGWTCTLAPLSCSRADALAPAASYPALTLSVDVSLTAPASLTNTATVSTPGDPNPANDTATDVTTIAQLPDLAITKSHAGTFTQGQPGTYTVTVSNVGPGPTTGTVTVTDTLPAGLTATGFSGTGWTCTLAPLSCSRADALAPAAS